ncbi:TrmH family RNA methyltransferase [Microbacterium resistens]|uniref:TrmH family RNA methyltransferase n=1 Tax=Microbacterium resistens TaxID=156977 RepID=UPI00367295E0
MNLVPVDDPADPRLDDFRGLTDVALRQRSEPAGGLYIAESEKVIARAIGAGHRPRAILTQRRWLPGIEALLGTDGRTPVYLVPDEVAEGVTGYAVHRGALASMHRPALPPLDAVLATARTVLVLEDVRDHTNVGAAFRAAAGLGADAVLVSPRCGDPLYRRSVRVSMGTVFQVPWTRFDSWEQLRRGLEGVGMGLAALALDETAVPLDVYAATRPPRVALAFGAEGDGLSRSAIAAADAVVTIPMSGGVDSLNIASTAAVVLWALGHPPAPQQGGGISPG